MAHPRELDSDLIDAYLARRALDYLFGFTLSPGAVAQAARRQERGPRAVGRAAPDRRPRARDRGVQGAGILVGRRPDAARRDRVRRAAGHVRRAEARAAEHRRCGHRRARQGRGRGGALHGRGGRDQAAQAQSRRRRSPPRRCSRKPRASSAIRPATRCGWRRRSTRRARSPTCAPTACRWTAARSAPRARAITDRFDGHYLPEKPRIYQTKAKNAQEAHEAIRPTDFHRDARRLGRRGQALRPDLQARDGEPDGRGQPRAHHGHAARPDRAARAARDRPGGEVPRLPRGLRGRPRPEGRGRGGRRPAAGDARRAMRRPSSASTPTSTSPSRRRAFPRRAWSSGSRSSASAGLRLMPRRSRCCKRPRLRADGEEPLLRRGFGPPADRVPRALLRALRRLRLHRRDGGRARRGLGRPRRVEGGARGVLARLQAQERRGDGAQALRSHRGARRVPVRLPVPAAAPTARDPRLCPKCVAEGRDGGRLSLRGGKFGAFIACSNYPECTFTPQVRPAGRRTAADEDESMGTDPESGLPVTRRTGRFGPYIQLGEGKEAKRASIPKDLPDFDLDWALQAAEPAARGRHASGDRQARSPPASAVTAPTSRTTASTPSCARTARGVRDRHERRGHAARRSRQPRRRAAARAKAEPIKTLGAHPTSGGEMKVMPGRYGPYVTDGTTNATLPQAT